MTFDESATGMARRPARVFLSYSSLFGALLLAGAFVLLRSGFVFTATAGEYSSTNFVVKQYDELSRMEVQAEVARREYWHGHYAEAATLFEQLSRQNHASTALYLCELGLCKAAQGDFAAAGHSLQDGAEISEASGRADLEKKALSKFGREAGKIFRGDPYERACAYLLLALMFMDRGDYDNALAACKSGIIADSDASENRYDSDFTLLHLLEAKCHLLRGSADAAVDSFKLARQSYRLTHPKVRDLYAQRQDWLASLKLPKKERKQLQIPEDDNAINARVQQLDVQLENESRAIDTDRELGPLLTGRYNALLIFPQGKSPTKRRTGTEGNTVVFDTDHSRYNLTEAVLDGGQFRDFQPLDNTADVQFQATTRGGRRMDSILKGKVAFRRTTVSVGRSITDAGNQTGGYGGLAAALLGAMIQGIGGAVSPEADTRCWKTLPSEILVVPLELPPGEHETVFWQSVYFEKRVASSRKFTLAKPEDFRFLYAPPSLAGKYSFGANVDHSGAKRRQATSEPIAASPAILLPPILGLGQIEKFPSDDQAKRPRGFSPEVQKAVQHAQQALVKAGFTSIPVTHAEALEKSTVAARPARAAFQCELLGLDLKISGTETCLAEFEFALINTATGQRAFERRLTGSVERSGKYECAEAFYSTLDVALAQFFAAPEFAATVKELSAPVAAAATANANAGPADAATAVSKPGTK